MHITSLSIFHTFSSATGAKPAQPSGMASNSKHQETALRTTKAAALEI